MRFDEAAACVFAARSTVEVAVGGNQPSVPYLGKNLGQRTARTLFPQATSCCLWIFLWKTRGQNVTDFFSCTPRGYCCCRSARAPCVAPLGCPHRNPLAAHK